MKEGFIKVNFKDAIEGVNLFKKASKDVDEMDLNSAKAVKEEFELRLTKDEVYLGLVKERECLSETLQTYRKALSQFVCGDANEDKEIHIKEHIETIKKDLNEIDKKLDDRRKALQESREGFMDERLKTKEDKTKVIVNGAIAIAVGASAAMLHPTTREMALKGGKKILEKTLK